MDCKCVSCGLDFTGDLDALKEHYRGDLHRYNLKRRAASMPPIDATMFQRLRGAATAALEAEATAKAAEPKVFECPYSKKKFKTRAQYQQYTRSKKFKALAAKAEARAAKAEAAEAERPAASEAAAASASASAGTAADGGTSVTSAGEDAGAEMPTGPDYDSMTEETHCMFDAFPVDGIDEHVRRARVVYGFIIPDEEYLLDLRGLLRFCMAKVIGGAECLYCAKRFRSPQACQQHMRDSAHCRLPMDLDGGEAMDEYAPFFDYDAKDAKNGWLQEGVEELPSGELRLASGRVLGRKALMRFYKQRHRPTDPKDAKTRLALESSRTEAQRRLVRKFLGEEQAALVTRGSGAVARMPTVLTKAQKAARKDTAESMRRAADKKLDVGLRHNKTQSRYFRIQNFQWAE